VSYKWAVRLATFNVNSIKARLPYVLHWLGARQPDVVCLQELKVESDKFPFEQLEQAGYYAQVHGQKRWNGVAVLTREPAELVQAGLPGSDAAGARLVTVRLRGMTVTSVYVPNGKAVGHADFEMKLDWLRALAAHLRANHDPAVPMVIGGDFNVVHRDADSHDPDRLQGQIFHTAAERACIDALLQLGLVDLYRALHPEGRMFSWWDYRAGAFHKNLGLRIDLLLASRALLERAEQVWTDRDYRKKKDGQTASDHAPVVVDFDAIEGK